MKLETQSNPIKDSGRNNWKINLLSEGVCWFVWWGVKGLVHWLRQEFQCFNFIMDETFGKLKFVFFKNVL
jgi:hypothetical protein